MVETVNRGSDRVEDPEGPVEQEVKQVAGVVEKEEVTETERKGEEGEVCRVFEVHKTLPPPCPLLCLPLLHSLH